ncbi:MAG: rhodanese-like domain-containing protein, partial [Steroidobacteraceae bacterium]|nr:rhodanese-like domain-containing protein [Steroidobacteraceae bacterium]MDW8260676.1 rhodanese-like domain-containing protein [Gammaproteobacteria bacterium]
MVDEISVVELKARWDRGERPFVLDVREPWERELARIEPTVHVPMNEIPQRLAELPTQGPLIVMCRSGGRSLQVAQFLVQQGFRGVANLT